MSETLYADIRAALTQQLATMPGLTDVAWENTLYLPVGGVPYLIPSILWAEGKQAELGANGRNWERGIYQVTCVYPPLQGPGAINAMAGKIRDRFKRGTVLLVNGVVVTVRVVYLGPTISDPLSYQLPISIAFYCQAAN